jgi:hypothetical protein
MESVGIADVLLNYEDFFSCCIWKERQMDNIHPEDLLQIA